MGCKGCLEWLLKLLNFLLSLVGLAMVAYGMYLFVVYQQSSSDTLRDVALIGRPLMVAVSLNSSILEAWFIYLFIGVGCIVLVISVFGCIGAATRNGCCLSCEIPTDETGDFDMMYDFLKEHWNIAKWVALGAVILEALVFLLALIVRAANRPEDYDSDDELINAVRQPLVRPTTTGVTVTNSPSRNDAWSTRMREKYGLDTSEFQPVTAQPVEERSRCAIM